MAKILEILCSPRDQGNSTAIADAVTDGAMGLSTNIIELCRLNRVRDARGCQACRKCKETGKCVLNDDISCILEKMREADCIIVATPVYFGGPSAQFKILEDRMFSFLGNGMVPNVAPGKKVIIVVTCSRSIAQAEKVSKSIRDTFETCGFEFESEILFSDDFGRLSAADDAETITFAKGMGLRFRNT